MSSFATTLTLLTLTLAPEAAAPAPAPAPTPAAAPAPIAAPAQDAPTAAAPAAAAPAEEAPVAAPAPAPAAAPQPTPDPPAPSARVSPPTVLPANPHQGWEPDRPKAFTGKWLVGTSIGLGAVSWGLTIGQVGMVRGCSADLSAQDCLYNDTRVASMGGLRALANVSNWGVAGTAGAIKGNYDAIDHVWTHRKPRRTGLWIGGGIGLALAGMTTGAVSAGLAFGGSCEDSACTQNLSAYLIASQAAQSMFTAGLGMAAYGMVYHYEYKDNHAYKNRLATLRAAPTVTADFAGASLSGRF